MRIYFFGINLIFTSVTIFVRMVFVTVMFLEETPAVLSLGNVREDHGYTDHWTSGQKPHLTKKGNRIDCNSSNYVPLVPRKLLTSGDVRRLGRDVWNSRAVLWTGILTVHWLELLPVFLPLLRQCVCVRRSPRQHEHWRARPLRKDDEHNSLE